MRRCARTSIASFIARILGAQPAELAALFVSFAYFFFLLCGYYILRPLRDEMGIAGGVENLPWVFTATFLAMLCAVPLFGWLTSRYARRHFLPIVYGFFILNLLAFYAGWHVAEWREWLARAFFVWLSVLNLFVVSVFWSFMADLYSREQGRRLFGVIAAGGSAGAIAGPALTATLVEALGAVNMMLVSAGFLFSAIVCVLVLPRLVSTEAPSIASHEPLGGGVLEGLTMLARSRYLLGIAAFIVGLTVVATFVYFEQAHIVRQSFTDSAQRTAFFARIDLAVNVIAVSLQLFGTGRLVRRFGLGAMLAFMPLVNAAGLLLLAAAPLASVLAVFQSLRRAGEYAITRPAREALFTVVPRNQKYKAKNVIDTLVYRAGDALGGWMFAAFAAAGLGLPALAVVGALSALLWFALARWLGNLEKRQAASQ